LKWNKYTLITKTEAEDFISSMMLDVGIEGIEIEDHVPLTEAEKAQMFVDILPDSPNDDGTARISFYLDPQKDNQAILAAVQNGMEEIRGWGVDVGEALIIKSQTEDKDWINNWKEHFHQFYVDDILIKPSWEEVKPEDREKLLIQIDPGTAFGTGMHETTQLCIRQLKKYITEKTMMLDVGTGSGILSIVALKLGAEHTMGTDLDPCALHATEENMEVNGISKERYSVMIGNLIDDEEVQKTVGYEKYNIVVANILVGVLTQLTPVVVHQLKPGGIYITSGILVGQEEAVKEAMKQAGLTVVEVSCQGEWACVTAKKN